jgi:hypothetical protein
MTDRDQVFAEFALRQFVHGWSADAEHWQVDAMADEIIRLRAILAMLKKPDIDVLAAAMTAWSRTGDVPAMLHAAIATAEREVASE